ncbi:MAG: hypothetical protein WDW36_002191 [Sanguina aurantia]
MGHASGATQLGADSGATQMDTDPRATQAVPCRLTAGEDASQQGAVPRALAPHQQVAVLGGAGTPGSPNKVGWRVEEGSGQEARPHE